MSEEITKFSRGLSFPVLDHGHVIVRNWMGSEQDIVDSARLSYGQGTKSVSEDRNLIRYLIKHQHTTPLESCELQLDIKLPIFVARQLIRHRTANLNEVSARYSELPNEMYIPKAEYLGRQSKDNKQGRSN